MSLRDTLGNNEWMTSNKDCLRNIFPKVMTDIHNLNGVQLKYRLKLLGIDWRSDDELVKIMIYLERVGIIERDGKCIRASRN